MSPFIFTNQYRWQPVLKGQAYEKQFHVWYDYAAVLLLTLVSDIDTWGEKWDVVSKTLINSDCELFRLLAQRKELCEEDVFWKSISLALLWQNKYIYIFFEIWTISAIVPFLHFQLNNDPIKFHLDCFRENEFLKKVELQNISNLNENLLSFLRVIGHFPEELFVSWL